MSILNELDLCCSSRIHRTTTTRTICATTERRVGLSRERCLASSLQPANRTAGFKVRVSRQHFQQTMLTTAQAHPTKSSTTYADRSHSNHELYNKGQSAHIPLTKKTKRTLGHRQTRRSARKTANNRRKALNTSI